MVQVPWVAANSHCVKSANSCTQCVRQIRSISFAGDVNVGLEVPESHGFRIDTFAVLGLQVVQHFGGGVS